MNLEAAQKALKKHFGYDAFRPMQAEIIQAVYAKKDALVLMPTGGGKSLCYQIPAITCPGLCVVVSPLISLMKDQVESLTANGLSAAYLNSSLDAIDQRIVEDQIFDGKLKLLYVSPEKLLSNNFIFILKKLNVNLFAIDEAHCISNWGHDFRPEYTQLSILKKQFPQVPILALTATADKITRRDIIAQLQLPAPELFIASFDRPNLSLNVLPGQKRIENILDFIKTHKGQAGIIYCLSRKSTEQVADRLKSQGIAAAHYHAQLSSDQRSLTQEDFKNDRIQVVCATVAFGMGIDKSNVRWVIHYNLPKSIESYYQEIGRAGRDGAPADALLFYSFADTINLRSMLEENDSDQMPIKLAKLERMQQFAESLICRRRVLLNYFNENYAENCQNCDICKNPPQQFDGTIVAQKALSAVYRLGQQVPTTALIGVLRGSKRKDLMDNGFHLIKTYGAGAEHSEYEWQHFIGQMVQLGLLEIAYDQHHQLQLTPLSNEVLFQQRKVQLVKMQAVQAQRDKQGTTKKSQTEILQDELSERLRTLRRDIAREQGIPPYLVLTDTSLNDLAQKMPSNDLELANVSGFGERKIERFGRFFLEAIRQFSLEKSKEGSRIKGATYLQTLELYERGLSVADIAQQRGMQEITVYSHLGQLYEKGEAIDIFQFVTLGEIEQVDAARRQVGESPPSLKALFEALDEKVAYHKIRLALSFLAKPR
jgi:ATP-dependent DNA helicase RecQ